MLPKLKRTLRELGLFSPEKIPGTPDNGLSVNREGYKTEEDRLLQQWCKRGEHRLLLPAKDAAVGCRQLPGCGSSPPFVGFPPSWSAVALGGTLPAPPCFCP